MIKQSIAMTIIFITIIGLGVWMQYLSPGSTPKPDFETHYPGGE